MPISLSIHLNIVPEVTNGLITFKVRLEMLEISSSVGLVIYFDSLWATVEGKIPMTFFFRTYIHHSLSRAEWFCMTSESFFFYTLLSRLTLCRFTEDGEGGRERERSSEWVGEEEQCEHFSKVFKLQNLKLPDRYGREDQHQLDNNDNSNSQFHRCSFHRDDLCLQLVYCWLIW